MFKYIILLLLLIMPYSANYGAYITHKIIYNAECIAVSTLILDNYMESIGFRESSGRYDAVNSFGYMGKYQFAPATLRNLGFDVRMNEFLFNPQLQDSAMISLLHHNYKILKNTIYTYDGTEMDEYTITKSGILAAAHLVGPRRTRLLLERGIDTNDAYGTTALSYLIEFSGYDIELNL